jgi:uncharacterized protein YjlB
MLKRMKYTVQKYFLKDDGRFPNNASLPVLLYKGALDLSGLFPGNSVVKLFEGNNWKNSWKDGIYDYQHYHSNTHEVLGVYRGRTTVQLGGPGGVELSLEKGDVLLIPAGVAHKNITPHQKFKCVGAYPEGVDYDLKRGHTGERPSADRNIRNVPLPLLDPVEGEEGAVQKYWRDPFERSSAKKRSNPK